MAKKAMKENSRKSRNIPLVNITAAEFVADHTPI